jgi:hypothetical protein
MSTHNWGVLCSINDLKVPRQNRDDDLMECVGAVLNVVTFGLLSAPILMDVNFERTAMVFALGKAPSLSSFFSLSLAGCLRVLSSGLRPALSDMQLLSTGPTLFAAMASLCPTLVKA